MAKYYYDSKHEFKNSSVIHSIYYNTPAQVLFIEFKNSNTISSYINVSLDTFIEFTLADSAGQFYNRKVKGLFQVYYNVSFDELVQTANSDKMKVNKSSLPTYKARVEVTGTLELTSNTVSDMEAFLVEINKVLASQVVDGTFKIREVTQVFVD